MLGSGMDCQEQESEISEKTQKPQQTGDLTDL